MTNQLIETLENKHKEMGLLIQQLKSANITIEDVKEHFGVATDVIVFEGQKYRKVDRLAREGDLVIFLESVGEFVTKGKPYKVHGQSFLNNNGYEIYVYNGLAEGSPETVDVYEPITSPVFATNEEQDLGAEYAEQVKEEKTPNQLRAEIIEKAKGFVKKYLTNSKHGYGIVANNSTPLTTRTGPIKYKFVVNVEKRTIVAIGSLLHTGRIDDNYKGIAKCMPGDVFNEHISKAIALGRALGLDVSEFENAVQPNEVVMGMDLEIRTNGKVDFTHEPIDEEDLLDCNENFQKGLRNVFITNDTHAQYGGNA